MLNLETIETSRLILKGFSPEAMNHVFTQYPKPEIMKTLGHLSEEDYLKEEHKHRNGYSSYNRSFILFLLIDKTSGQTIGRCGIHNWNVDHRRAEIGYHMQDENFKRKGLMTEAVGAIIKYGFDRMNLQRLEALVSTENIPSLRLMEKYNFVKEGLLRQHYYINNKYEDSLFFSKLYSEYIKDSGTA